MFTLPIELVLLGHSLQLLRAGGENWSILENVPEMTLAIINKKKDVQTKMTLAIIYWEKHLQMMDSFVYDGIAVLIT